MRRRSSRCLNEEEKGRASDTDGWMGGWIDDGLMIRFGSDLWIIVYLFIYVSSLLLFPLCYLSICLYVHLDVLVLIRKYQG